MRYEGAPTHYRDEEKPHIVLPFLKRIDALTGRRFRMGCKWPSHYNMRLADSQIMKLLPIRSSLFVNRGSIKDTETLHIVNSLSSSPQKIFKPAKAHLQFQCPDSGHYRRRLRKPLERILLIHFFFSSGIRTRPILLTAQGEWQVARIFHHLRHRYPLSIP